jgi:hypothetical protein
VTTWGAFAVRATAYSLRRSIFVAALSALMIATPSGAQGPGVAAVVQRAEVFQNALATWQKSLSTMTFGQDSAFKPSLGDRRDQCLEWIPTLNIQIARVSKKPGPGAQFGLLSGLTYFDNTLINLADALELSRTTDSPASELETLRHDQEAVAAIRTELQGSYTSLESELFLQLRSAETASQPGNPVALNQPAEITGHVYQVDTGRPLADVTVMLESPQDSSSDRLQRTGEDGTYRFSGIAPGNYWVIAYRSGFVGSVHGVKSLENASEGLIPVAPGLKCADIDFQLSPAPEVTTVSGDGLERADSGSFSSDRKQFAPGAGVRHFVAGNSRFIVTAWQGQLAMATPDGEDPFNIATGGQELYSFVFDRQRSLVYYPVSGRYFGAIVCFELMTRRYQATPLPFSEGLNLLDVKREGDRLLANYTVDGPCVPKALPNDEDPWILPTNPLPAAQAASTCVATIPIEPGN